MNLNELTAVAVVVTAETFGIPSPSLHIRDRHEPISTARAILWHILRYDIGLNAVVIARLFSRSGSTVSLSTKRTSGLLEVDRLFADQYREVESKISKLTKPELWKKNINIR